jgi:hypothetical protein
MPRAVGGNGAVVVGGLRTGGGFYWMPTTGVIYIGGKEAIAVSRDGQTIVGTGISAPPDARFEAEELLVGPLGPVSEAQAINHDGSIIAGTRCSGISQNGWILTTRDGIECLPAPAELRPGGP